MSARTRRVGSLLGTVAGLVLALPALASGATVAVAGANLTYPAVAGEANTPQIAFVPGNPGQYRVTGDAAPLAAGAGCAPIAGGIGCADTGITQITVNLDNLDDQGGAVAASVGVRVGVNAGDGNDSFTAGPASDQMIGGIGNDTLNGGDGDDTLTGEAGNDTLNGGPANDTLNGGADNDTLNGGDGGDRVRGGAGDDVQNGEGGFDFFGEGDDPGADSYNGGGGADVMLFNASPQGVTVTLDNVTNDGTQGLDNVGADVESVSGSPLADNLTGNDGPNVIEGQAGPDLINGGGGDDQLWGTTFIGLGDSGNVINGGAGNDILVDGAGDDLLNGGDGDDQLNAGPGADDMSGGNGNDTATWGDFTSYPNSLQVLNQLTVTLDDVPDDGYATEGDNARSDNENITGFFFNDILRGNASPNIIDGGVAGEDLLDLSGAGPDTALCGTGNETVIADPDDVVGPEGSELCNHVSLTGPRSVFLALFASNKAKKGVAKVNVNCMAQAVGLCDGSVRILKGGTTVGREEFELLPGEATVLGVELSDSVRDQLNKGKKVSVQLRAVGSDNSGIQELDIDQAKLKGKKKKGK